MPNRNPSRGPSRAHATSRRRAPEPRSRAEAGPYVLGALLRGQPELRLLADAVAGLARLQLVDQRLAVVSTVLRQRPATVVVAPFDSARVSTAPLVVRLRREAPDVAVLVVSSFPAGAGQPILRAVQAGAHAVTSPSDTELRAVISSLLESRTA